jgi:mannosyl-3-phosphoglycerate synthase
MRIESPRYTERFGAVRLNDVQKVVELDSGRDKEPSPLSDIAARKIEEDVIKDYEEQMAIVIPTMNEKLKLFEGVISGVPHECLLIVVSNSQRKKMDRFKMEEDTLEQFCHFTRREALILHQKDEFFEQGLAEAGYTDHLAKDGRVRDGKAEGMMLGILTALLAKKEYIGFIDADNYFPGAVWEYVRCYAASFSMAKSPYAMIRILWRYKPKVSGGVFFQKWGRVSQVTNRCMNSLVSNSTGFETDVVKTGNAGEHAMSLKLAEILPYASGYAVEPQELVSIFEEFGGVLPMGDKAAAKLGVEVSQIETRNPHIHEERGSRHLKDMLSYGLGAIYHSSLCEQDTREMIVSELLQQDAIKPDDKPPKPRLSAPLKELDLQKFAKAMEEHVNSYSIHKD